LTDKLPLKKARRTRKKDDEKEALKPYEKYELIERTVRTYQLKSMTTYLCHLGEVSKK